MRKNDYKKKSHSAKSEKRDAKKVSRSISRTPFSTNENGQIVSAGGNLVAGGRRRRRDELAGQAELGYYEEFPNF